MGSMGACTHPPSRSGSTLQVIHQFTTDTRQSGRNIHLQCSIDVLGVCAVLRKDPQRAGADARGPDLAEGVQQAGEDGRAELGVSLHDLPDEEHHIQSRAAVGVPLQWR